MNLCKEHKDTLVLDLSGVVERQLTCVASFFSLSPAVGKKKAAPAPKLGDSINMLREAQVTLEKREKHLEKQVAAAREAAKEKLKAKDKRGAIHLLKRSKLLETQINQIYGKKANIDIQIMALESAASNKEIFEVRRAQMQGPTGGNAVASVVALCSLVLAVPVCLSSR